MSKYKNELLLLLSTVAYGVSYPVCKYVQGYMSTSPFMGLRGLMGFLTVAVWYFFGCHKNPQRLMALKNRKMHGYALICSVIGGTGMYLSMYALNYTMASKASFLTCTYVLMMPIVSFVFFKGKSSTDQLAALLAATGGMALISGVVSASGVSLSEINKGDLMTLTAAVIIAFQAVYLNWFSKKLEYDVEAFTMVQMFFTAVIYIVAWQVIEPGQGLSFDTPLVVLSTVYVGVGVAGFGFLAFNGPVKQLPPARSAIILATEPIFGAVGAYFIRDRWGHNEVLTPLQMLGCAVVLAAVLGSELYSQRKARKEV